MSLAYSFKILLLGSPEVGKTSLLFRFVKNKFQSDLKATIGVEFLIKEIPIEGNLVKLTIWDVGGAKRFKALQKTYYNGTHGAFLVFDLTRANTFEDLSNWHAEMKEIIKKDIPFVIIGNKVDLVEGQSRDVNLSKIYEFIKTNDSIYIETSAKTGEKVENAFRELTLRMIKKYDDVLVIPD